MTRSAWWLTCDALAVYRLTLLVVKDTITEPLREKLRARVEAKREILRIPGTRVESSASDGPLIYKTDGATIEAIRPRKIQFYSQFTELAWLFELVTCPWCVGVWAAGLVTMLTVEVPQVWQYPAFGLALAAAAGFLSERS